MTSCEDSRTARPIAASRRRCELVEEYLAQHVAAEITITTLRYRLQHGVDAFGRIRIDRLTAPAIGAWRKQLPAGSAHYIHRSLRRS